MTTVAILQPGSMGAAIARELSSTGKELLWLPHGRSPASSDRAERAGVSPAEDPAELFDRAHVVLSICPPGAPADEVADLAVAHRFRGLFIDVNSISTRRMAGIAARLEAGGAAVVDGSIIGTPPSPARAITVYLAGPAAHVAAAAELFTGTQCLPHPLAQPIGAASALKAAYSSYQKAAYVLAGLSHALAHQHGLGPELLHEATHNAPGTPLADPERLPVGAAKAWRWIPEFAEMADTFTDAGLPTDVQPAVAAVLAGWSELKDTDVSIEQVIASLIRQ